MAERLRCIVENCGGELRLLYEAEDDAHSSVNEYACVDCHIPHYLPVFKDVEMTDDEKQVCLTLDDPNDGRPRKN
jgi:hypothetical protein